MKAFNNDAAKKQFYVDRMNAHIEADELVQGEGWENGKGCFIGCTMHEYSHQRFEEAGIGPEWLARLAEEIFEGLSNEDAQEFAKNFYPAILVGANLDSIKKPLLIFVMQKSIETLSRLKVDEGRPTDVFATVEICKHAIMQTMEAHKTGQDLDLAAKAADNAARAADSAARAADSAAASAARAADSAAASAAWAARANDTDSAAARKATYKEFADKLIELLKSCES